ncbi:MAG: DNA repair exonuclease [Candidatus Thermoplasmatota archaeon]|jgi:DNA repair exonuclease SbcCD nuclease subunit|nr:DNA repair exonuclease [Candidatus Thermoplasmatota archaeon]
MMKILHVADTHLGYSAYRRVNEEGLNQREVDTYDAFEQFIDYALKSKPDLIIHAGDLFDSVRPTNRAITFAIHQILRLSKREIPFVVIAGNHEHPKLRETGHIFSILDHIENVYPVYNSCYEIIPFEINNEKIVIHAMPQTVTKNEFEDNLKKIKTDKSSDYNILVAHGGVKGIKEFSMNEFNELIIPTQYLKKDFDYIALGHYHKYVKLSENTFYSGSTERFTFSDAGEKKGFIEIELGSGKNKNNFISLKNRPMINLEPIDCSNITLDQVMNKIKKTIKEIEPSGKIFRIILENIPSHVYRGIDFSTIREISSEAVHYEIKANVIKEGESKAVETSKIDALTNEFELFLRKQNIEDKEALLKLGLDYIQKIESREEKK